ncbi:helix-turn-helix transcriptional regulator [Sinorhizobium fredii]|uniref:helix-turn-helix transcriptional regulator n=1 Tax=Rhizobium fredii TaxID=380 RepID=UPI003515E9C2
MKKLLKQHAGQIDGLCEPKDHDAATMGFEGEIAKLRSEVASLKANRPTGPPINLPVLLSLNEVCRLTSLSRTAINRWRSLGRFPGAVPLGDKRVAFVKAEVEQWILDQITERDRRRAQQNSHYKPLTK